MTFITYFITFDGLFLKVPKHYHLNFRLAKKRLILNEEIRAERVRLLDERGEQIGIVTLSIALEKAREKGLELALVATHPENPVCKFMDYGKYQYEQKKQQRKQQSKAKKADIKGIRLGLQTGQHDMEVKVNAAKKFLAKGHPLKVQLQLKGRQMMYKDLAVGKIKEFAEMLSRNPKDTRLR